MAHNEPRSPRSSYPTSLLPAMKRLVICADGTWKSDDEAAFGASTNIVRIRNGIPERASDDVPQKVHYVKGVGADPNMVERLLGGLGKGLSANVLDAYRFVAQQYEPGDELYMFGFSRGAFTVRSLAGLVRNCGIVRDGATLPKEELQKRINRAYDLYRDRAEDARPSGSRAIAFRRENSHDATIKCLGVFDTVGSLGIPTQGPVGILLRRRYGFHDVRLSRIVENAFHALAIDELRKPFAPTLWEVRDSELLSDEAQHVEQRWFAGVHSNVGGGYDDRELSNLTLGWMIERVEARTGLEFSRELKEAAASCDCGGKLYDSYTGWYKRLGRNVRPIAQARTDDKTGELTHTFEAVDDSAAERYRRKLEPAWRPENFLDFWKRNPDRWPPDRPPV